MSDSIKILDCTLRDGGYYNNWDFSSELVSAYLQAVAKARIDYVELGLREFSQPDFLGAFAYTSEQYLNSISLPVGPIYGVMVNAKTILECDTDIDNAIDKLFVAAENSKISLVRVAAHFDEVERSGEIVKKLKELGYVVGFNLMQAGGKSRHIIEEKAKIASSWDVLDVLYFADSLGNMDSDEVCRIFKALRCGWQGPLGIHAHNNMNKALDNTLVANDLGITWLDATVSGMGRGAGNTPTEMLLASLCKQQSSYYPKSIYDIVIRYFEGMQKQYGWGGSLLYFIAAQNCIHPTYIQNLLSDTHYGPDEIVGAIDYLSNLEGTESYSNNVLDAALTNNVKAEPNLDSSDVAGLFEEMEVLIVSGGASTSKYKVGIECYIKTHSPVVIAVNMLDLFSQELVDYYCISRNVKFLSENKKYKDISKPVILPFHRFTDEELAVLFPIQKIDFGFVIERNRFDVYKSHCVAPYDLTIAYAIAVALAGGATRVSLVGVDGYQASDPRQLEMIDLIEIIDNDASDFEITALTPTSYPLKKGSIYAPAL